MQRILIIGDIHANYPALLAVERFVESCPFDQIVDTGDLTVYSTFPNQTVKWFRKRSHAASVLGTTDRRVLKLLNGMPLQSPRKHEKLVMYQWTANRLTHANIAYLKTLPPVRGFTIGGVSIGVCHGSFDEPEEALFPWTSDRRFRALAAKSPYQIQIMGHSHTPFYRVVKKVHFINPGSVGRMFDGDPRPSFAILEIRKGAIDVKHFRIPYPVQKTIKGIEKNQLPAIYAKMYQKARKLN